jgi:dUTP pyrophosphatase
MNVVKYKKFDETKELFLPSYQTEGASGMDLISIERVCMHPGTTHIISTNLTVEIPQGYEIQIRPRSGLAAKNGVPVLNSPGTIDSDYRGEIKVILFNSSKNYFNICIGDRIAQMVLAKVEKMVLMKVVNKDELSVTERGEGGFGSTGLKTL